jgi:hypothetical protein
MVRVGFAAVYVLGALTLAAAGPPTFHKDILPIFQKNCQGCHRRGEIGPMPLLTYEGTRPWAKAIKAAVVSRKMPPWFADPKFGHFQNDRRLSAGDIEKIVAWVDAGAPAGDPKDQPPPITWREGWNIRPDAIFQMPEPYKVPAVNSLSYVYVVIPTGFAHDTWVTAAEIRPGARSVVHHALAVVRPPGSQWMREATPLKPYLPPPEVHDGEPGKADPQATPVNMNYELLAAYSPGMDPERFDIDRSAKLVPAHSDIVLQLHYTANGKSEVPDQTRIGLTIATEPPQKRFMSAVANAWHWAIPPGDPNYEAKGSLTFGEPVELVFLQPHMHLRGKDMTVRLIYPGGKSETLLSVPQYSFNWQVVYYLEKPLKLPTGAKVEITAHWDNSANNPFNPDPRKTITWGNQSWDEMLSLPMGVIIEGIQ